MYRNVSGNMSAVPENKRRRLAQQGEALQARGGPKLLPTAYAPALLFMAVGVLCCR